MASFLVSSLNNKLSRVQNCTLALDQGRSRGLAGEDKVARGWNQGIGHGGSLWQCSTYFEDLLLFVVETLSKSLKVSVSVLLEFA